MIALIASLLLVAPPCTPERGDAAEWLARARTAAGISTDGSVLHFQFAQTLLQDYQSDRTYPPFFSAMSSGEEWYDAGEGAERVTSRTYYPGGGPLPANTSISGETAAFGVRDTMIAPSAGAYFSTRTSRTLNPWAVLHDWSAAADVKVVARCTYRDYPRLVLQRTSVNGVERLFLDPKTGFPVKLERTDKHYLWGQQLIEYVYSNWKEVGDAYYPTTTFRMADGETEMSRTIGNIEIVRTDSAPRTKLPDAKLVMTAPDFFNATKEPDTIRVGPKTFLLRNPMYTTGVTQIGDTIYLLDATLSEARARQDSAWVARLFPGKHPIVLVVTDLAWPHVGGFRFWAANGATIYTHPASREFLQKVFARRWTLAPDQLEKKRATAKLVIRNFTNLANGKLRLAPIDGISSEAALIAFLADDEFLWASDYIQQVREPSAYLTETYSAARKAGFTPKRAAAQHLPVTEWPVIAKLAGRAPQVSVIRPGDDVIKGSYLRAGSYPKRMVSLRNGATTTLGTMTQVIRDTTINGEAALVSVVIFPNGKGTMTDSTVIRRSTLQPILHRSHSAERAMALDFAGSRVTGQYAPADKPATTIGQSFETSVFDSSVVDLVLAGLPLHDGYEARLPFYLYERGGLVWATARVEDGTGNTWLVRVDGLGPQLEYTIDKETRDVVGSRYVMGPGVEMRLERM